MADLSAVENDEYYGAYRELFVRESIDQRCARAAFLFPSPSFQETLAPYLARFDNARAAGGAVVGLQLRSGYADRDGWAGYNKLPEHHGQSFESRARMWNELDLHLQYCPEGSDPAVSPGHVCWDMRDRYAQEGTASGGRSCWVQGNGTQSGGPLPLRLGDRKRGFFSSLAMCAVQSAASRSPAGPQAPWLVFVAGDFPPLYELLVGDERLVGHAMTAEGAAGHGSFHSVCDVVTRKCIEAPRDPGGAWTRTMLDLYLLGALDAVVHHGMTTFFTGAIGLRAAWMRGKDMPESESEMPEQEWVATLRPVSEHGAEWLAWHASFFSLGDRILADLALLTNTTGAS
jgi:hypothetical protein